MTFWQLVRVHDADELTYILRPYIAAHANMVEIHKYT